jgi:Na+-transporting NADH:ubiquinone oxidoreductase subunit B
LKPIRNYLDKIKPNFEEGGKFRWLWALYDGAETFFFAPNHTSKSGVHIHDARDSKRTMITVLVALMPALLVGIYNLGYQHYLAIGEATEFADLAGTLSKLIFGLLAVLPHIVVVYAVGLGIEIVIAQWKKEEVAEGFFVSGMIIVMIMPIGTPLWMLALATAFGVIFAKEIFGGTGYNVFNVALVARAFLFFSYPSKMSGDQVWVAKNNILGIGGGAIPDGFSGATPLAQLVTTDATSFEQFYFYGVTGQPLSMMEMFIGLIPGSIGEGSLAAILLGAILLLVTGVASWKIMLSVFAGGFATVALINALSVNIVMEMPAYYHFLLGGFAFGAVFMATDPVTAARTETGKWIYGLMIGFLAIVIRVFNPGFPEGMMLAILFMNAMAPLIDYYVVDANVKRRMKRAAAAKALTNGGQDNE